MATLVIGEKFKFQVQDTLLEYFFLRFGDLKNKSHFLKKSYLYLQAVSILDCLKNTQFTRRNLNQICIWDLLNRYSLEPKAIIVFRNSNLDRNYYLVTLKKSQIIQIDNLKKTLRNFENSFHVLGLINPRGAVRGKNGETAVSPYFSK